MSDVQILGSRPVKSDAGATGPTISGTDPVQDGSDTTFVSLTTGPPGDAFRADKARSTLLNPGVSLSGTTGVRIHIRAKAPVAQRLNWTLMGMGGDYWTLGGFWNIPGDGAFHDLDLTIDPSDPNIYIDGPAFGNGSAYDPTKIARDIPLGLAVVEWMNNGIPGGNTVTMAEFSTFLVISPVPRAHHGTKAIHYKAGTPAAVNAIEVHGPGTPNQGDSAKHQGLFAIDQTTQSLSAQLQVASPTTNIWVQPVARYYTIQGSSVTVGNDRVAAAVPVAAGQAWTPINFMASSQPGATHWLLVVRMYADAALSTPLPQNTEVYFDSLYVPDNGLDLVSNQQPYLDGDQPNAIWEGDPENSTSRYLTRADRAGSSLALDHDLPLL